MTGGPRPTGENRGYVRNLLLDEDKESLYAPTLTFFFRPGDIRAALGASYGAMTVQGMSHQYKTYEYTDNQQFTFSVYYNALMMLKERGHEDPLFGTATARNTIEIMAEDIEWARRFMEALLYPGLTPTGTVGSETPNAILCIPGIVAMRCRLMGLGIDFLNNTALGAITELRLRTTWEEAPLSRVTMQDQLERGSFRAHGS